MRLFNQKKIEHFIKKTIGLSEPKLLKRRARRYLDKNTEKELGLLPDLVDRNKASIDIGVYRGVYSYFLSNLTEYVYSFEANTLLQNKLINAFENKKNVKIENLALSSSSGTTELRVPIRDANADYDDEQKYELGIATIHSENKLNNKNYEIIKNVKKITLDEYNFLHKIGFIKIDVEGHELEIIRGGKNFIEHHKPVMLIEIEERHAGKSPMDIIYEICSHGYKCFIVNEKLKLKELSDPSKISNNNFIFKPK